MKDVLFSDVSSESSNDSPLTITNQVFPIWDPLQDTTLEDSNLSTIPGILQMLHDNTMFSNVPEDVTERVLEILTEAEDVKKEQEDITLNIWDFAGQELYYTTHQVSVFLTILC